MKTIQKLIWVPLIACFTGTAVAAQDGSSPFSLDGYVGVVSDYRDRGLSLSDRDFAVIGSVGLFHDNGFYLGVDAASIDDQRGGDAQTQFYAGYTIDRGDFIYDLSFELDGIHGDSSRYFPEIKATVSRDFGLAFTRFGTAYAFDGRWNNPSGDSFYFYSDIEIPVPTLSALTILTHVGHDFRDNAANLWDWSVGLSAFVGDVEFSATFEDSSLDQTLRNQSIGQGRFILGARLYF